jgi:hypothetical protein
MRTTPDARKLGAAAQQLLRRQMVQAVRSVPGVGPAGETRTGRSYAPMGQTPVTRATGQRFGCNMISAITNKSALAFMVFQGRFRARSLCSSSHDC